MSISDRLLERSCETCSKMQVCKIFAQAALFESQFAAEYSDIAKLPFPAKLLALNCKEFSNANIDGKLSWLTDGQLSTISEQLAKLVKTKSIDGETMYLCTLIEGEKLKRMRHEEYVATKKMQTS